MELASIGMSCLASATLSHFALCCAEKMKIFILGNSVCAKTSMISSKRCTLNGLLSLISTMQSKKVWLITGQDLNLSQLYGQSATRLPCAPWTLTSTLLLVLAGLLRATVSLDVRTA